MYCLILQMEYLIHLLTESIIEAEQAEHDIMMAVDAISTSLSDNNIDK